MPKTRTTAQQRKRRVRLSKAAPLPVLIETITGELANNGQWFYYRGTLAGNSVVVEHPGDIDFLYRMGFFGKGEMSRGQPDLCERGRVVPLPAGSRQHTTGSGTVIHAKVTSRRRYMSHLKWQLLAEGNHRTLERLHEEEQIVSEQTGTNTNDHERVEEKHGNGSASNDPSLNVFVGKEVSDQPHDSDGGELLNNGDKEQLTADSLGIKIHDSVLIRSDKGVGDTEFWGSEDVSLTVPAKTAHVSSGSWDVSNPGDADFWGNEVAEMVENSSVTLQKTSAPVSSSWDVLDQGDADFWGTETKESADNDSAKSQTKSDVVSSTSKNAADQGCTETEGKEMAKDFDVQNASSTENELEVSFIHSVGLRLAPDVCLEAGVELLNHACSGSVNSQEKCSDSAGHAVSHMINHFNDISCTENKLGQSGLKNTDLHSQGDDELRRLNTPSPTTWTALQNCESGGLTLPNVAAHPKLTPDTKCDISCVGKENKEGSTVKISSTCVSDGVGNAVFVSHDCGKEDSTFTSSSKVDTSEKNNRGESVISAKDTANDDNAMEDGASSSVTFSQFCEGSERVSKPDAMFVIVDSDEDEVDNEGMIYRHEKAWKPVLKCDPFPLRENLRLSLEEAYFLSFGLGCLEVLDSKGIALDLTSMWCAFCQRQKSFLPNYIAYHYFRSKNWVPKPGLKFGCNFLLYKDGPPFFHGSYSVVVKHLDSDGQSVDGFENQRQFSWMSLAGLKRITEHVGKELLFCYVIKPKEMSAAEMMSPKCISQFQVKEVLVSRWVSSQEREGKGLEEIP